MTDAHAHRRHPESDRRTWERLIGDHDSIASKCSAIVALTNGGRLQCGLASRLLLELAVLVADHLGVEDEVVDMTAIAMRADYTPETIAVMAAELDRLKQDWKTFIVRWLPAIPPAEWLAFRSEASTMLDRLSQQVRVESELLYDGALRYGLIGLGGAVVH